MEEKLNSSMRCEKTDGKVVNVERADVHIGRFGWLKRGVKNVKMEG